MTANTATPPARRVMQMEYLKAFRFLFDDPNWGMNLLLGSVLMLIPIVGPIVFMGWQLRIMQHLVKGEASPIPRFDFSDFGFYLGKGVIPFVVSLLVMLPFFFIIFILIFGSIFGIGAMTAQHLPGEYIAVIGVLAFVMVFALGFFPMAVFGIAALTRAYLTEDFGPAMNLSKIMQYAGAVWKRVLIAYLIFLPLSFVLMFVGMAALYVGMYPAMVIMNLAWVYITWEIYQLYLQEGGEPIPMKDPLERLPSQKPPTGGSSAPAAPTPQTAAPSGNPT